ncbi:hypothetical protein AB0B31_38285 [Catellatospora citrea]|uniref:hypothetical protein n=1 Tax=Catellatospora citrea TaxID=53366 RepID=UPI0033CC49CD
MDYMIIGLVFVVSQAVVAIVYITMNRRNVLAKQQQDQLGTQLAEIKNRMDSIERVLKTVD